MSKKEKVTEQTEQKVMTRYDQKMQRRKEAKEREKKQNLIEKLLGIAVVVALVGLIASFPIRAYMAVNQTFVKINGENISKVEFDYNYYVVKNDCLTQYGSIMSMMGLDANSDFSTQMYSDTMTWEDYFEQQTVDNIIRVKALKAEADAKGFTVDAEEDFEEFKENVKAAALEANLSEGDYLKQAYGPYATISRIKNFVKESIVVNAYYNQVNEENTPSEEELQAHYEANKNYFDSVDYRMTLVEAQLPTEPTELADPVEETEDTATEGTYKPSEAEIEKAMADAKELAEAAEATVATDGELRENNRYSETYNLLRDWLFDDTRKEGDTTVVEDTTGKRYYVVSFINRYRDDKPTADARLIMAPEGDGQAILDEWKSGDATEESFGALADKYNEGTSFTSEGGLYQGITAGGTEAEIAAWLLEEGRVAGDTTTVTTAADGSVYVIYYVGPNKPEWQMNAEEEILTAVMESYLQEITQDAVIEDINDNLEFLKIEEAAATEAETTEEAVEATEAE